MAFLGLLENYSIKTDSVAALKLLLNTCNTKWYAERKTYRIQQFPIKLMQSNEDVLIS